MTSKTLHIIRGASGSGKSTFAKQLIQDSQWRGHSTAHAEADQFRYKNGKYVYIAEENQACHTKCEQKVQTAMNHNIDTIVVANTFVEKQFLVPYLKMAETYGYQVQIHIMTGEFDNVHDVPLSVVQQQKKDFEP